MSILRVLSQHILPGGPAHSAHLGHGVPNIARSQFKIIYVAPMKALAAEIVRKLTKRLSWVKIRVRELTGPSLPRLSLAPPGLDLTEPLCPGDMQLTRAEIEETQVIVTTPEKWDVVTRKPTGEGELASVRPFLPSSALRRELILSAHLDLQKVKLLIIDEVHLLNEDRGAVIETIVARTLRQVRMLSATASSSSFLLSPWNIRSSQANRSFASSASVRRYQTTSTSVTFSGTSDPSLSLHRESLAHAFFWTPQRLSPARSALSVAFSRSGSLLPDTWLTHARSPARRPLLL